MKKKSLALTMATVMVAGSLAGCGGTNTETTAPVEDTTAQETTQSTESSAPVENVTEEVAVDVAKGQEHRIGCLFDAQIGGLK